MRKLVLFFVLHASRMARAPKAHMQSKITRSLEPAASSAASVLHEVNSSCEYCPLSISTAWMPIYIEETYMRIGLKYSRDFYPPGGELV